MIDSVAVLWWLLCASCCGLLRDTEVGKTSHETASSQPPVHIEGNHKKEPSSTSPVSLLESTVVGEVQNITAQLRGSVFLPCQTHQSMERLAPQVSWIRKKDWHILTSGTKPYTKEERFTVHHAEGGTSWTLGIKYVQLEDAGTYECQIVAGTGRVSHVVHLQVVVPRAVIPGKGEYHVETGSTISLDCFIEQSPTPPQYIFWYHNNKMINYDRERGGVSVRIETGPKVRSSLTVSGAREADSGNYTCAAANTESASIFVYITAANKIAAVQPRAVDSTDVLLASCFLTWTSSFGLILIGSVVTLNHLAIK